MPVLLDDTAESIEPLIDEKTKAIYVETIGNPALTSPILKNWRRWLTSTICR
jgi:O-acetylhomoserine/O-acetylserine sulfhydrylase-like pyridoxal-dependent enzyme